MFEKVKAIIAKELNIDESKITLESSLSEDLGADSLDAVELIMALEEEFDIEVPETDADKIVTVGDAVEYIKAHQN